MKLLVAQFGLFLPFSINSNDIRRKIARIKCAMQAIQSPTDRMLRHLKRREYPAAPRAVVHDPRPETTPKLCGHFREQSRRNMMGIKDGTSHDYVLFENAAI